MLRPTQEDCQSNSYSFKTKNATNLSEKSEYS